MTRYMRRAWVLLGEQLAIAAVVLAVAFAIVGGAAYAAMRAAVASPLEVTARPPVIELKNERMTVLRLQFEVDGRATRDCHFTYFEDSATWRLQC